MLNAADVSALANVKTVESLKVYENLAEQPPTIFSEIIEEPQLCMLLNPKLTKQQVGALMRTFYIVTLEHEGKQRLAILCGFYQRSRDADVEPQVFDLWDELAEEEEEE